MLRRRFVAWFGATLLAVLGLAAATAGCSTQAAYPSKAIEMVVAYAPGGGADVIARVVAKHLSADLGVPVNVTNKAGGNQIPGVLDVLNSPADGYKLLFNTPATSSMHGTVKDLPYKVEDRTFGPIIALGAQAFFINGKSPWNSWKDVADAAKKDPGSFTWGFLGGTAFGDFTMYMWFDAAGVDFSKTKPVGFDGAGPLLTAVAGGHVMFGTSGTSAVMPLKASGDIKVIGIAADTRAGVLPDVPSAPQAGFPSVNLVSNYSIDAPKGLPKNVLDRIDAAAKKFTADPAYKKDMDAIATDSKYATPDQAHASMLKDMETFKTLMAKSAPNK